MAAFGPVVLTVGVGHRHQMANGPPQPGRVQPPGRLDQHRFGLGSGLGGQVVGALGQHAGVGGRELPSAQRLGGLGEGAAEQGPGGPHRTAGRPGTQAQLGGAATRRSSPPGCPVRPRRPRGRPRRPARPTTGLPPGPPATATPAPARPAPGPPARTDPGRWPARRPPRAGWPGRPGARRGTRRGTRSAACPNWCSSPWPEPIKAPTEHKHQPENVDNPGRWRHSRWSPELGTGRGSVPARRPVTWCRSDARSSCRARAWGPSTWATAPEVRNGAQRPGHRARRLRGPDDRSRPTGLPPRTGPEPPCPAPEWRPRVAPCHGDVHGARPTADPPDPARYPQRRRRRSAPSARSVRTWAAGRTWEVAPTPWPA